MNLMESIMEWRSNEIHEVVGWACFLAAGGGYGLAGQPSSAKGRQAKPNNQQQMNGIEELVWEWNESLNESKERKQWND